MIIERNLPTAFALDKEQQARKGLPRVLDFAVFNEPKDLPKGARLIRAHLEDGTVKEVPVFNCRDDAHHEAIAERFADYEMSVAFGVGLYGLAGLLKHKRADHHPDNLERFYAAKSKRSPLARIPVYGRPRNLPKVVNRELLHDAVLATVDDGTKLDKWWKAMVAGHVIVPIKAYDSHIHEGLITWPDIWPQKTSVTDQHIPFPTISYFWWDDPDWERIAKRIENKNRYALAGISSFNESKELPAFTFEDVLKFIEEKGIIPFDFVVTDPQNEEKGVKSSHIQILLPLKRKDTQRTIPNDDPRLVVYRKGATDIEEIVKQLGYPHGYRFVEDVSIAAHGHGELRDDKALDQLSRDLHKATHEQYKERHPQRNIIHSLRDSVILWNRPPHQAA